MNANPYARPRSHFGKNEEFAEATARSVDTALRDELHVFGSFREHVKAIAKSSEDAFAKPARELAEILRVAEIVEPELERRSNDPDPYRTNPHLDRDENGEIRFPVVRRFHEDAGRSLLAWPADLPPRPPNSQTRAALVQLLGDAAHLVRSLLARACGGPNDAAIHVFGALDLDRRRCTTIVLAIACKTILQPKIGNGPTNDKEFRRSLHTWCTRLVEGELVS